jgi:L-ascorbate metabolism protein UlaG (beta-lactamase superfamily)
MSAAISVEAVSVQPLLLASGAALSVEVVLELLAPQAVRRSKRERARSKSVLLFILGSSFTLIGVSAPLDGLWGKRFPGLQNLTSMIQWRKSEKEARPMKLTWLGHSCFLAESGGYTILLDPYRSVPGLKDIQAEVDNVYCSHGHFDHAYTQKVRLRPTQRTPFAVKEINTFHDEAEGALRGENVVRCLTAGGVTVAHLGDLGHTLSDAQLAAIGPCDAILIPVGGTYTIDAKAAKQVADSLGARVIIPMHYRCGKVGLADIATVDDFLAQYPESMVRRYDTNTIELTENTPPQVAVLGLP